MKYLQESRKRIFFVAAFLGMTLTLVPLVAMAAAPSFTYNSAGAGKYVNAVNDAFKTTFTANSTLVTSGTSTYNFVGRGVNDTFLLYCSKFAAAGTQATLTGATNDTSVANPGANFFTIFSGNGTSTFSLISGAFSTFTIYQNNTVSGLGTQTFAITGGHNSTLTESGKNIYSTYYSINLGDNSTVSLNSIFNGTATTVNVIF